MKNQSPISLRVISLEDAVAILPDSVTMLMQQFRSFNPNTFVARGEMQARLDMLPFPLWLSDSFHTINLVNAAFAELLEKETFNIEGKPESDYLAYPLVELFSDSSSFLSDFNSLLELTHPMIDEFCGQRARVLLYPFVPAGDEGLYRLTILLPETMFLGLHAALRNEVKVSEAQPVIIDDSFPFLRCDAAGVVSEISLGLKRIAFALGNERNILENKELLALLRERKEGSVISFETGNYQLTFLPERVVDYYNPTFMVIFTKDFLNNSLDTFIRTRGEMYSLLFERNPMPMVIYAVEDYSFMAVNMAAVSLYGYSEDEFLRMDITDLYNMEDIQSLLDKNAIPEGTFSGPYKHRTKDGRSVMVMVMRQASDYNGREAHILAIKDIGNELEKEQEVLALRESFNGTGDCLFITDRTGFITRFNNAAESKLEYFSEGLRNSSLISLLPDQDRSKVLSIINHTSIKEADAMPLQLRTAKGRFLDFEVTIKPLQDFNGEVSHFLFIAKEQNVVTVQQESKPVEVVREVVVERQVMVDSTGSPVITSGIDPAQISYIFHELLTPINVILGFIYEIRDTIDQPTAEQKEFLEIINQNRDKLLYTMNSIGEFAQTEQEMMNFTVSTVSIDSLVKSFTDDLKESVNPYQKKVVFERFTSNLKISTDLPKLRVLMGLLVKLASHVTMHERLYLSLYQTDAEQFIVTLNDNEGNLSEKLLHAMENLFSVPDVPSLRALGMSRFSIYTVKKLLHVLGGAFQRVLKSGKVSELGFVFPIQFAGQTGGEIHAIPETQNDPLPESGRVQKPFIADPTPIFPEDVQPSSAAPLRQTYTQENQIAPVVDPRESEPARKIETAEERVFSFTDFRCLYIEDQLDAQVLFKTQFKDLRSVDFAQSFEEALPLLNTLDFDFIVLDINIQGDYNGMDALRMIRQMPSYKNTPIIASTAYVLPGDKEKFVEFGFSGFISKPIFRDRLMSVLKDLL